MSFVLCTLYVHMHVWVAITKVEGYICVLCPLSFVQFSPYLHIYIYYSCVFPVHSYIMYFYGYLMFINFVYYSTVYSV